jgi:zinc protease
MTRDDLYGYYRRYYVPNNATLVIVGDVDAHAAMKRAGHYFGAIEPRTVTRPVHTAEPEQLGERRVTISKPGTTAYLKLGYHAPAVHDPEFFAMLALDAVLTGAKGMNVWSMSRTPPPQRSARLYRALVDRRLASSVAGSMLPTQHPFLYTVSLTASEGTPLEALEDAALREIDNVRSGGVTPQELQKVKNQLRARLVFENDSVTNIAHQLGYFQTVASLDILGTLASGITAVTADQVADVARKRLTRTGRTIGWFQPSA